MIFLIRIGMLSDYHSSALKSRMEHAAFISFEQSDDPFFQIDDKCQLIVCGILENAEIRVRTLLCFDVSEYKIFFCIGIFFQFDNSHKRFDGRFRTGIFIEICGIGDRRQNIDLFPDRTSVDEEHYCRKATTLRVRPFSDTLFYESPHISV